MQRLEKYLESKIPQLVDALQGRFTEHHAFMVRQYLSQIDAHQQTIDDLTARIEAKMDRFRLGPGLADHDPGIVSTTVAEIIIAETGADMTVFPTAAHLASWAGVRPGNTGSSELRWV